MDEIIYLNNHNTRKVLIEKYSAIKVHNLIMALSHEMIDKRGGGKEMGYTEHLAIKYKVMLEILSSILIE